VSVKKLFAVCSIVGFLTVAGPAGADLRPDPIVVQPNVQGGANIQVALTNGGDSSENLSQVLLEARNGPDTPWRTLKVWDMSVRVGPHKSLALSFKPDAGLVSHDYELRVTLFNDKDESRWITSTPQQFESAER
jgi:hypothetical protein